MTVGWVLIFRKFNRTLFRASSDASGQQHPHLPALQLSSVSKASYGMYLCHMVVLAYASSFFRDWLGIADEGSLGLWTTPVEILLTALTTFCLTAIVCTLVQRIPRLGKWIVG